MTAEPFVVDAAAAGSVVGQCTMGTLLNDLRDRLDEVGTARFWSQAELRRWINEGTRDVGRRAEVLLDTSDIAFSASDGENAGPTDMLRIHRGEWRPTGDTSVYPLEYRDFQAMDEIWLTGQDTREGTPMYYTMWGFPPNVTVKLYPMPAAAGSLRLYYYRLPASLATDGTDDSAIIELPAGWCDLVVLYGEYVALRKDHDARWQEAKALYEERLGHLMDMTRRWSDQQGYVVSGTSLLPGWLVGGDW